MRKFRIKLNSEMKKQLVSFSIFFGIVFFLTVILVTFTLLSRNSWKSGLALEMQLVLDSYQETKFTVNKNLPVESTLSSSVAVYSLLKRDVRKDEKYYGVIVRMPSILGPLPAVFVYSEAAGVSFAGYAIDNGKASATVAMPLENTVMRYWEDMIPKIIAKTESL